jgi:mono/diheme cytochrome c family protein
VRRRERAAAVALLVAACHGDARRTGVPADTALRVPTDTALRFPTDTAAPAPDTTALDSTSLGLGAGGLAAGDAGSAATVLAADSAAGDALYHGRARCFTCHGERGEGAARLGPDLTDSTWVDGGGSLDAIRGAIARGVASPRVSPVAMPAYAGTLSADEIARTAAYVYALSHPGATVADTARAGAASPGDSITPGAPAPPPPSAPLAADSTHPAHAS